ncbi:MFS transporter [Pseudobutyrivibrio sp.]|uniref:MFS transporter n=1 Tax=Pseudobutyrivibrio sp. TaxID=2014367 RepID=UPI0025FA7E5B|nr:MFS transporter [Pseudobutyrivibrio sp.]MBR5648606.1 MFS transporter [Pseudobutyrivibrio sp.]
MLERFKTSNDFRLNFQYFLLQGFYWMIVCCAISLGSAYLSDRGYSTAGIGILFALAFALAALLQPIISINTDNSSRYTVVDVLTVLGIIVTLDLLLACTTSGKTIATGLTFFVGVMFAQLVQPFLNALNFFIEDHGVEMNYGVARANGSFFFFIISLVAGNLMKATSERALPIIGFIASVCFMVVLIWMRYTLNKSSKSFAKEYDPFEKRQAGEEITVKAVKKFITDNIAFFVIMIGVTCFFFGHVLINNFIYQITSHVGGDEADTGGILALAALVELPAMIFFNKIKYRFSTKFLFGVSAFFFFIKMLFTSIATNVGMLYFSMIFQALAFALFIPASVHFVDEFMAAKDSVKGQAFLVVAMTLANALASFVGGGAMFSFGVTFSLWFSTAISLAGVLICIYGLFRINAKK